jgi:hypothetical protein
MAYYAKKHESRHRTHTDCPDCLSRKDNLEGTGHKELRTASDLIAGLREDKHALKDALQAALSKNEELYDKVMNLSNDMKEERRKRKAADDELKKARGEVALFDRKVAETKDLLKSREQELVRLERLVDLNSAESNYTGNLEAANRSLKAQVTELRTELEERERSPERSSRKVAKYSSFICNKLNDLPDYFGLFRGRFKSYDEFTEGGLLKTLQFLADLLMFEAQKPGRKVAEDYSDEEVETASHYRSYDKSMQTQADKATSTQVPPRPLTRGDKPISPSIGRDSSYTYAYETPKHLKEAAMKDTSLYSGALRDSTGLIEVLSFQNEKLNRLNQQIAETMASSRTLLNTSGTFDSRARSSTNAFKRDSREPSYQVQTGHTEESFTGTRRDAKAFHEDDYESYDGPSKLHTEQADRFPVSVETRAVSASETQDTLRSPTTAAKSPYSKPSNLPKPSGNTAEPGSAELELPGKTEFLKSPSDKAGPRAKSPNGGVTTAKTAEKKPVKKERVLKTMPVMHRSDGWGSVGEFFGRSEDDKKKQEDAAKK